MTAFALPAQRRSLFDDLSAWFMALKASVRNSLVDALVNQANYTAPTAIYISLHTGDPGDTGASEANYTSYARVVATTKFPAASSGSSSNDVAITFPTSTGGSNTVTYCGIWDASSAGNWIGGGALTSSKTIASGDSASFATSNLTVSIT